jgi:hypothetical protein
MTLLRGMLTHQQLPTAWTSDPASYHQLVSALWLRLRLRNSNLLVHIPMRLYVDRAPQ